MAIVIREAGTKDLPALGKLGATLMRVHHAFDPNRFLSPGPDPERGYASFLGHVLRSDDGVVIVAELDEQIVGYTYAAIEPLSWKELRGPAGFIHDIVVDESQRRSGVGKQLLAAAIDWLRKHDAPRVILWTAARNGAAQTLFKELGFQETMLEMTLEL